MIFNIVLEVFRFDSGGTRLDSGGTRKLVESPLEGTTLLLENVALGNLFKS